MEGLTWRVAIIIKTPLYSHRSHYSSPVFKIQRYKRSIQYQLEDLMLDNLVLYKELKFRVDKPADEENKQLS